MGRIRVVSKKAKHTLLEYKGIEISRYTAGTGWGGSTPTYHFKMGGKGYSVKTQDKVKEIIDQEVK